MSRRIIVGSLSLFLIVIGLSVIAVHAPTYSPAVSAGQWAKYTTLYDKCKSSITSMCQESVNGGINDTAFGLLQITGVSGTTVTLNLFTQYKNGTSSSQGGQVDVATGYSTITGAGAGSTPPNFFILAGGLQAGDHLWSTSGSPTLNQTVSEQVLGSSRTVNILNYTVSSSYLGSSFYTSTVFKFDQQYGMFISISFNVTTTSPIGSSQNAFAFSMVDNNLWLSSTLPSFTINSISSITFQTGSSGTATIKFTGQSGYSTTIRLSVNSPAGLTCTLDRNTAQISDSVTLTCNGQPGSYIVTITANDGYSAPQSQTANVNVQNAQAPTKPSNNGFPLTYVYVGVGVAVIVALAAFLVFRSRKPALVPEPTVTAPPDPSPGLNDRKNECFPKQQFPLSTDRCHHQEIE